MSFSFKFLLSDVSLHSNIQVVHFCHVSAARAGILHTHKRKGFKLNSALIKVKMNPLVRFLDTFQTVQ